MTFRRTDAARRRDREETQVQATLKVAARARESGEPIVQLEVVSAGFLEPCLFELLQDGGVIESNGAGRFTVREPGCYLVIIHDAMGKGTNTNQVDLVEGWFT